MTTGRTVARQREANTAVGHLTSSKIIARRWPRHSSERAPPPLCFLGWAAAAVTRAHVAPAGGHCFQAWQILGVHRTLCLGWRRWWQAREVRRRREVVKATTLCTVVQLVLLAVLVVMVAVRPLVMLVPLQRTEVVESDKGEVLCSHGGAMGGNTLLCLVRKQQIIDCDSSRYSRRLSDPTTPMGSSTCMEEGCDQRPRYACKGSMRPAYCSSHK